MPAADARKTPSLPKKSVYRGVTLQGAVPGRTRFTLVQFRKAVEAAVAKNADILSALK